MSRCIFRLFLGVVRLPHEQFKSLKTLNYEWSALGEKHPLRSTFSLVYHQSTRPYGTTRIFAENAKALVLTVRRVCSRAQATFLGLVYHKNEARECQNHMLLPLYQETAPARKLSERERKFSHMWPAKFGFALDFVEYDLGGERYLRTGGNPSPVGGAGFQKIRRHLSGGHRSSCCASGVLEKGYSSHSEI